MSKRVALVPVDYGLLVKLLQFPEGTVLTGVRDEISREVVLFRIEHTGLELAEAEIAIPYVKPIYRNTQDGRVLSRLESMT